MCIKMSDILSSPVSVAIAAAIGGGVAVYTAITIANAVSNLGSAAQQRGGSRSSRPAYSDDYYNDSEGGTLQPHIRSVHVNYHMARMHNHLQQPHNRDTAGSAGHRWWRTTEHAASLHSCDVCEDGMRKHSRYT